MPLPCCPAHAPAQASIEGAVRQMAQLGLPPGTSPIYFGQVSSPIDPRISCMRLLPMWTMFNACNQHRGSSASLRGVDACIQDGPAGSTTLCPTAHRAPAARHIAKRRQVLLQPRQCVVGVVSVWQAGGGICPGSTIARLTETAVLTAHDAAPPPPFPGCAAPYLCSCWA